MPDKLKASQISDQDYQTLVKDFNAINDISLLGNRLDQLFEKVVEDFPCSIALIHNEFEISFKDLNASANIIARALAKRDLGHGDVVGLAVSRSIDLIVGNEETILLLSFSGVPNYSWIIPEPLYLVLCQIPKHFWWKIADSTSSRLSF